MAFDRDSSLKKAETLLRQGRLDGAITQYVKVLEHQPGDWASANTLGDLYGRAGRVDDAVAQYSQVAAHFIREGFLPRAAALYKKILKVRRDDEHAQLQLAEIAVRQGLLADARKHFAAVGSLRRARGDHRGEAEILVRLGSIDRGDIDARMTAARTLEELGEQAQAAERYKELFDDLAERDRPAEALDALRQLVRLAPDDVEARRALARAALDAGDTADPGETLGLLAGEPSDSRDRDRVAPVTPGELQADAATTMWPSEDPQPALPASMDSLGEPADAGPGSAPDVPVAVHESVPVTGAPEVQAQCSPALREDEDIDLTEALGASDSSAVPDSTAADAPLEAVFRQMREQVRAAPDQSAQHLTLGRTYLEVGMVHEGLSALETAARSPGARFEAASLLGRFYQQRDDTGQAIEWLERAAEAAPAQSEDGRALLYELGLALEAAGERARALAVFRTLTSDVHDYRDVATRIGRLGREQSGG